MLSPGPGGQRGAVSSFCDSDDLDARDFLLRVPTKAATDLNGKSYTARNLRGEGCSHFLCQSKPSRNALVSPGAASARALAKFKSRSRNRESSESLLAGLETADLPSFKMGQEDDDVTQTFTGQQHQLDTLIMRHIDLWRELDRDWTEKQIQDSHWRTAIDVKLQTIINLLGRSVPTALQTRTSQTVADNSPFGQCLFDYKPAVTFTEKDCRSR